MVAEFFSPFGVNTLFYEKSESQIEPMANARALYTSEDREAAVYTDDISDTYYLRDGGNWYGLAAFSFCGRNRTHFRDYLIQEIRISACPAGTFKSDYQSCIELLWSTREHGKAKVTLAQIRALFERALIDTVIIPLLPRSDSLKVLGAWQLQEELFRLGFKPEANSYLRGEMNGI